MCDPEWSSYISNERYKAGLIDQRISYKDNIDIASETMDKLPDLESVSFIGGEFFIVDSNIKILEKIKQRGLTATIITNATVINPEMLELLKSIPSVEMRISVDGVASGYEFIRYPASWKTLEHNVEFLKQQLPHADLSLITVIQMLSCQQIHELCEWANRRRLRLNYQVLSTPSSLRFSALTQQERDLLVKELEAKQNKKYLIARPQKEMIDELIQSIRLSESDQGHRFQCVDFLSKLCAQRKVSAEQIVQQFGVLGKLAQEIIDSCVESKRFAITKK
jgi:sulfatase maturation enzyme AslB (radical SAM superfamily)